MARDEEPQLALDEKAMDLPDLEKLLEDRLRAKDDVAEVRGVYKLANDAVSVSLEELGLEEGEALRIGRFRVTKTAVAGRTVSFETAASTRVRIDLVDGAPAGGTMTAEERAADRAAVARLEAAEAPAEDEPPLLPA